MKTANGSNIIEVDSFRDLPIVSEPEMIYYAKDIHEYLAQCDGIYCAVDLEKNVTIESEGEINE